MANFNLALCCCPEMYSELDVTIINAIQSMRCITKPRLQQQGLLQLLNSYFIRHGSNDFFDDEWAHDWLERGALVALTNIVSLLNTRTDANRLDLACKSAHLLLRHLKPESKHFSVLFDAVWHSMRIKGSSCLSLYALLISLCQLKNFRQAAYETGFIKLVESYYENLVMSKHHMNYQKGNKIDQFNNFNKYKNHEIIVDENSTSSSTNTIHNSFPEVIDDNDNDDDNETDIPSISFPSKCNSANALATFRRGSNTIPKLKFPWVKSKKHAHHHQSKDSSFSHTSRSEPGSSTTLMLGITHRTGFDSVRNLASARDAKMHNKRNNSKIKKTQELPSIINVTPRDTPAITTLKKLFSSGKGGKDVEGSYGSAIVISDLGISLDPKLLVGLDCFEWLRHFNGGGDPRYDWHYPLNINLKKNELEDENRKEDKKELCALIEIFLLMTCNNNILDEDSNNNMKLHLKITDVIVSQIMNSVETLDNDIMNSAICLLNEYTIFRSELVSVGSHPDFLYLYPNIWKEKRSKNPLLVSLDKQMNSLVDMKRPDDKMFVRLKFYFSYLKHFIVNTYGLNIVSTLGHITSTLTKTEKLLFHECQNGLWNIDIIQAFDALISLYSILLKKFFNNDMVLSYFFHTSERWSYLDDYCDNLKLNFFNDDDYDYIEHNFQLSINLWDFFTSLAFCLKEHKGKFKYELNYLTLIRDILIPRKGLVSIALHFIQNVNNKDDKIVNDLLGQVLRFLSVSFSIPNNEFCGDDIIASFYLQYHISQFTLLYQNDCFKNDNKRSICNLHLQVINSMLSNANHNILSHISNYCLIEFIIEEIRESILYETNKETYSNPYSYRTSSRLGSERKRVLLIEVPELVDSPPTAADRIGAVPEGCDEEGNNTDDIDYNDKESEYNECMLSDCEKLSHHVRNLSTATTIINECHLDISNSNLSKINKSRETSPDPPPRSPPHLHLHLPIKEKYDASGCHEGFNSTTKNNCQHSDDTFFQSDNINQISSRRQSFEKDNIYNEDDQSKISHEYSIPLTTRSSSTTITTTVLSSASTVKNTSVSSESASTIGMNENVVEDEEIFDNDDDNDDDDDNWPSDLSMCGDMDEDMRKWEIYNLNKKLREGKITKEEYDSELRCISPGFDDDDNSINDNIDEITEDKKITPSPSLEYIPKLDFGNLRLEPSTELTVSGILTNKSSFARTRPYKSSRSNINSSRMPVHTKSLPSSSTRYKKPLYINQTKSKEEDIGDDDDDDDDDMRSDLNMIDNNMCTTNLFDDVSLHLTAIETLTQFLLILERIEDCNSTYDSLIIDVTEMLYADVNRSNFKHLIPQLIKRILDKGPEPYRLLRLIIQDLFDHSLFINPEILYKSEKAYLERCIISKYGKDIPSTCVIKKLDIPMNQATISTPIFKIYSEITILESFAGKEGFCQMYDYGIKDDSVCIVLKDYRCSLKEWRNNLKAVNPCHIRLFLNIFKKIVEYVQELHNKKIVHYDLKCCNILLEALPNCSEEEFMNPKIDKLPFNIVIADFGEAIFYEGREHEKTNINRGTEPSMPPEMLVLHNSQKTDLPDYDRRKKMGAGRPCDVWALGVLLFELITGELLLFDNDWSRFFMRLTRDLMPVVEENKIRLLDESYRNDIESLLKFILQRDQNQRPSIERVLEKVNMILEEEKIKKMVEKEIKMRYGMGQIERNLSTMKNVKKSSITKGLVPKEDYYVLLNKAYLAITFFDEENELIEENKIFFKYIFEDNPLGVLYLGNGDFDLTNSQDSKILSRLRMLCSRRGIPCAFISKTVTRTDTFFKHLEAIFKEWQLIDDEKESLLNSRTSSGISGTLNSSIYYKKLTSGYGHISSVKEKNKSNRFSNIIGNERMKKKLVLCACLGGRFEFCNLLIDVAMFIDKCTRFEAVVKVSKRIAAHGLPTSSTISTISS